MNSDLFIADDLAKKHFGKPLVELQQPHNLISQPTLVMIHTRVGGPYLLKWGEYFTELGKLLVNLHELPSTYELRNKRMLLVGPSGKPEAAVWKGGTDIVPLYRVDALPEATDEVIALVKKYAHDPYANGGFFEKKDTPKRLLEKLCRILNHSTQEGIPVPAPLE